MEKALEEWNLVQVGTFLASSALSPRTDAVLQAAVGATAVTTA